jgi:hypothetical protein
LIPNEMRVLPDTLELDIDLMPTTTYGDTMCNCGLKFIREGGRHSDWCNAYRKGDD